LTKPQSSRGIAAPKPLPYDAIVVGAGPNGLAAAITLAQAGRSVLVLEAKETIGGGTRTAALTLPGFQHDVCSAVHPLGLASPFLRALPLGDYGLEWIQPPAPLAHPLDGGQAVLVERSLEATARRLGPDESAYLRLFASLVEHWQATLQVALSTFPLPTPHFLEMARFGLRGQFPAQWLAPALFRAPAARAVFAGMAAHAIMPLDKAFTSGFGLILGMLAHSVGWPVAKGGSQRIAEALAAHLRSLGGVIETNRPVRDWEDLPPARAVLFDLTPRQMVHIMGSRLPDAYRRKLEGYRYGAGVFKLDLALDGPIPWQAAECAQAGTVHVGGTFEEIVAAERAVGRGEHPEKPFVLVAQQSLFDPTRAPQGQHTVWAYCHVPNGSSVDMTERIESQIERFAPGFRQRILMRSHFSAPQMEAYNPNYVGGDINGGVQDWRQLFTRPVASLSPYSTPVKGVYLCSSSTPPGGGVHGMCGLHAARAALQRELA
jgi:phytoene dehydrogenase-like protein